MLKKLSKGLIFTVMLAMLFATVAPGVSQAAEVGKTQTVGVSGEEVDVKVVEDSLTQRVVETNDSSGSYRSTFNKKTSELIVDTLDADGNIISTENVTESLQKKDKNVNVSLTQNAGQLNSFASVNAASLISSKADYTGKYKYYQYSGDVWVLQIPGSSKNPTKTPNNKTEIYNFRTSVNSIVDAQNALAAAGLGTMTGTAIAVATASGPLGWVIAALTALGLAANQAYQGSKITAAVNDAEFWFGEVTIK
ncbi:MULTISPECIES: geobacillin-26 family protein [Bacillus]|uniref:geobacillin-26 family protein n=1 Tax=Bacillus TaxID=1386 RepID=UPI00273EDE65|nr:geobacillin-26 family protein [Bacillus sp. MMSF_3328]